MTKTNRPLAVAGAIVWRGDDVLLIRRGKPPREGEWSIPGGHIEWGETTIEAVLREVREETGCAIDVLALCDVVEFIDPTRHLVLIDYTARWTDGDPAPGDDATDCRFVPFDEIGDYGLWDVTLAMIRKSYAQRRLSMADPD